jgi:intermediate filament protein if
MADLNERFASYIEKVRFLEAQNRRLADELDKLKARWGKETTQIKAMYQAELDEARKLLDDAEKEKARLEIRVASLEEQLEEIRQKLEEANQCVFEYREKIDRQNQQLSDYEAEINLLRRRVEILDNDRDKDKKLIAQLQDQLNRYRIDLDNETLLHIDAENRRQTLEEEIEFLKQVHEQEMKELAALAYRDTTAENREFWKNEMGQALREIQQIYDEKLDTMRAEMDTYYNLKIQEFRTGATRHNMESVHVKEENKRLKSQLTELRDKFNDVDARAATLQRELDILRREKEQRERELESENAELREEVAKLRAEMEAILRELQNIMDTKLGLELEIAAYRKLLEGEENRVGLRQVVDSMYNTMTSGSAAYDDARAELHGRPRDVMKGEMSAKTTYQRSAKGPVAIAECAADGKSITLENTGRKDEPLGGWALKRNIDGSDKGDYFINEDFIIRPGAKIKLWARGAKPLNAPASDLETDETSWGSGANINTRLVNPNGEDRATHVQKTIYT